MICGISNTASVIVENAMQLLDLLEEEHISPKCIIFLSVIQRTSVTRPNQVDGKTFNGRVKRFNKLLSQKLKHRNSSVSLHMFPQININKPKYIKADGVHLTDCALKLYCDNLKRLTSRYSDTV